MKKNQILASIVAIAITIVPAAAQCSGGGCSGSGYTKTVADKAAQTIVEIAANNPEFSTLVAAVKAAGLVETLSGGEFTVFAPTNAAFAKLPKETLDNLLKPESKDQLANILKYHVVQGTVLAADVKPGEVATVAGPKFTVALQDGTVMIDNATVTATDIIASNGAIHVIDTVILPKG